MTPLRPLHCYLALICLHIGLPSGYASLPVAGIPNSEFDVLDSAMLTLMGEQDISAGSLSIMKDGVVVFHHVYGWQDRERNIPLRPDAMFRIASVTKPITAAAIRKLIEQGKLSLSSKVFSLGAPEAGILDHVAFGSADPRLADITVDHLLQHEGGWDQSVTGDYTRDEIEIAEEMNMPSPPDRDDIIRYVIGKPLQFTPGATDEYSNFGYLLLGRIIEVVSGQSYEDYVQANVIESFGGSSKDWLIGRTFAEDQDSREPFYDDPDLDPNVYYPTYSDVQYVESPYGSYNLEARVGQGAIVATGILLLSFLDTYQVSGTDIGGPRPSPGSWKRTFFGSLAGTNSLARQRGDGINFVVLFNKRGDSSTTYTRAIRDQIDTFIDEEDIIWPTVDIRSIAPEKPSLQISRLEENLRYQSETGRFYQLEKSYDLNIWTPERSPQIGDGNIIEEASLLNPTAGKAFFRLSIR